MRPEDILLCGKCNKKFDSNMDFDKCWYLSECCHMFCKGCIMKKINI